MARGLKQVGARFEDAALGVKPSWDCPWICAKFEGHEINSHIEVDLEIFDETCDLAQAVHAMARNLEFPSDLQQMEALDFARDSWEEDEEPGLGHVCGCDLLHLEGEKP
ncbi:hypothetical protein RIF29_15875 [Crotalaria pallida]|uniref:Uncharacterized protein n=1 Tax=Crotalaria pallida TaxID=3830 RepID=A0AAN9FG83_CROPI